MWTVEFIITLNALTVFLNSRLLIQLCTHYGYFDQRYNIAVTLKGVLLFVKREGLGWSRVQTLSATAVCFSFRLFLLN